MPIPYFYNLVYFFESVCKANQDHVAIKYKNKDYTYQQLHDDSNLFASLLLTQGLKRGDVVTIINSKEYLSYALMLGCLKIGVVYTNIDPQSPDVRFQSIIKQCKPKYIFTDHECSQQLSVISTDFGLTIKEIKNFFDSNKMIDIQLNEVCKSIDGDAIAYIMFTSGSTGVPKGVAISHQNLLHFIHWGISYYQITPNDIFANVNPMHFDNSVFDFYVSLFSGASLVPINQKLLSSAKHLVNYIDEMKCTIWFSVPSLLIYLVTLRALQKENFLCVRIITFGGEGYQKIELKKLYDLYSDRVRFINVYGPTECTCICSSYELTDKDFTTLDGLPPLGYINPNFSFLIQGENNELANKGELCLLGPNVGRGYYYNEEATNKVFYEYTNNGYYRNRMYRTGDIVKFQDGLLFFIGRKDNQIKHMGHRIELEEIEGAINLIPEVAQVAVLYQRLKSTYGKIIAYVASTYSIDSQYIKEKISHILPSYMIPNKIVILDHLPKNQNGKIDKHAILHLINAEDS